MPRSGERLVVRLHSINRQRLLMASGALGFVLVFVVGWFLGGHFFEKEMIEKRLLVDNVARLTIAEEELRQQVVNAEIAAEVDSVALEEVRKTVVSLEGRLAAGEKELDLYRNLMSDDSVPKGLLIRELMLRALPDGSVAYRLVVQQKTSSLQAVKVRVDVSVEGELAGESATLSLDTLDSKVESLPLSMTFKYFEVSQGVMIFPEDFVPHLVHVSLWRAGQKSKKTQRIFGWRLEDF